LVYSWYVLKRKSKKKRTIDSLVITPPEIEEEENYRPEIEEEDAEIIVKPSVRVCGVCACEC